VATVSIFHQLAIYQSVLDMIISSELGGVQEDCTDDCCFHALVKTFYSPVMIDVFDVPG
jgi:hypothetical protein